MAGRSSTLLRVLKPIVAGIGLAYLVTAFVDKPAPVHFMPENPYAAKQEEIVEPQDSMVLEKNIMKLGSPLSVTPDQGAVVANNPLASLEELTAEPEPVAVSPESDNATESRIEAAAADNATVNAPMAVEPAAGQANATSGESDEGVQADNATAPVRQTVDAPVVEIVIEEPDGPPGQ